MVLREALTWWRKKIFGLIRSFATTRKLLASLFKTTAALDEDDIVGQPGKQDYSDIMYTNLSGSGCQHHSNGRRALLLLSYLLYSSVQYSIVPRNSHAGLPLWNSPVLMIKKWSG